jgi:hypothetical protein
MILVSSWSLNLRLTMATAGALSPIDALKIGGQDRLQLLLEGVRLHFGLNLEYTSTIAPCGQVLVQ